MNESEALFAIAKAIDNLASAIGGISLVMMLTLMFKSQSSNSGAESIASAIRQLTKLLHDKWHISP